MTTEQDEVVRSLVQSALDTVASTRHGHEYLLEAEVKLEWLADQLGAAAWDDPRGMSGNFIALATFQAQQCRNLAAGAKEIRAGNINDAAELVHASVYWGTLVKELIDRATMNSA